LTIEEESDSRYGFSGMEKDNEMAGENNSYDFGARLYNPRVGRWFCPDPLERKYPSTSTYAMTANNPIVYKDFDGKDYIIVIDHTTQTITIQATYYTKVENAEEVKKAIADWNAQSGQYVYSVGKGKNAINYDINFELTVQTTDNGGNEIKSGIQLDEVYLEDETGGANTYRLENYLGGDNGQTADDPGAKRGGSKISVLPGLEDERRSGKHEVGHTLGLKHWSKGIMRSGGVRMDGEIYITSGMIFGILKNAGINSDATSSGMDYEVKDEEGAPGRANATVEVIGDEPEGFNDGKVKVKKKK
jgi:RHS repeat-associated protein